MAGNETLVMSTAQQLHNSLELFFQNTNSPYLLTITQQPVVFFFVTVLLGFILSHLFVWLSKTIIKSITKRTETELDDMLLDRLQNPVALSLFFLSLNVALVPLSLDNRLAFFLSTLILSGNIFLVGTILNRTIAIVILHFGSSIASKTESTIDDELLPIIRRIITVVIYVVIFIFILAAWNIDIRPLLAGAGIAGLALAFAMQESLKNVFGGISLVFDRAFAIGDRVKLQDGTVGTVLDISLRSTKIRTFTGDLVTVPNGKIANESFQSYAQPTQETKVLIPFSVAYGSDVDKVKEVARKVLTDIPGLFERVAEDKTTSVDFIEMGQSSLNFRIGFWIHDYKKSWDVKLMVTDRLHKEFVKNKIEIPFPTQTLYLRKDDKA